MINISNLPQILYDTLGYPDLYQTVEIRSHVTTDFGEFYALRQTDGEADFVNIFQLSTDHQYVDHLGGDVNVTQLMQYPSIKLSRIPSNIKNEIIQQDKEKQK